MNPHALRHWILSPARLPFRHSREQRKTTVNTTFFEVLPRHCREVLAAELPDFRANISDAGFASLGARSGKTSRRGLRFAVGGSSIAAGWTWRAGISGFKGSRANGVSESFSLLWLARITAHESPRTVYRSLTSRPTAIPQGSDNSVKGPEMVALGTTLP